MLALYVIVSDDIMRTFLEDDHEAMPGNCMVHDRFCQ